MVEPFEELRHEVASDVEVLEPREFLIVEASVGREVEPYAQVAREPDGTWYCEVVSIRYLPAEAWPIDEFFLVTAGWEPPVNSRDNWSLTAQDHQAAASLLIDALRCGRFCTDPYVYSWTTGRFPDGGGGEELPVGPGGPYGLAV
jgi:hypothetical protein